jgi:hypothetical protein
MIIFAGKHLSYQGQWQEGAALSAIEAMKLMAEITDRLRSFGPLAAAPRFQVRCLERIIWPLNTLCYSYEWCVRLSRSNA